MSNEIGNDSFENLSEEDRKNIDILSTAIVEFAVEVEKAARAICEFMLPIIKQCADYINSYPNSRVKHLARYGKTKRIRKKNQVRIARDFLKVEKGNLNENMSSMSEGV